MHAAKVTVVVLCVCVCMYVCVCVCPLVSAASHVGITKQGYQRILGMAETFSYTTFIVPRNAIKLILYILFSQNDYKNFRHFVGPASQLPSRTYHAYEYTQRCVDCGRVRFRVRTGAQSTSNHLWKWIELNPLQST